LRQWAAKVLPLTAHWPLFDSQGRLSCRQSQSLEPDFYGIPAHPIPLRARAHKHGWKLDSADSPTGAVQNLFGSLLQTAEKVIGLHLAVVPAAIAAGAAAGSAVGSNAAATQRCPQKRGQLTFTLRSLQAARIVDVRRSPG